MSTAITHHFQDTSNRFLTLMSHFSSIHYIAGSGAAIISYIACYCIGNTLSPLHHGASDFHSYVKNDQFLSLVGTMTAVFGIWCIIHTIIIIVLIHKVFFKFSISSVENLERVVDSILLDSNNDDVGMLKIDFNDRLDCLNDSLLARFNTVEVKISKCNTTVNEYKSSIHDEYQNIKLLIKKVPEVQKTITDLEIGLDGLKLKLNTLNKETGKVSNSIDDEFAKANRRIIDFKNDLNVKLDQEEIQIFKCNALLVNAKILFELSLIRFENILHVLDSNIEIEDLNENKENILPGDSPSKLENMLLDGLKIINRLKNNENTANDIDSLLETEIGITTELSVEENTTTALLFDFSKRLDTVETQINVQERYIHQKLDKIRSINNNHNEKITEMRTHSEEWIIAWVSVIYGLFNSTFIDLQSQLLGNDNFNSLNGFIEVISAFDNGELFLEEFISHCKDTCLKVMKEVSLIIFEYYLIHRNINKKGESILPICQERIDFEVNTLTSLFEETLIRTKIKSKEYPKMRMEVSCFKDMLKFDMNQNAVKFNSLFQQNLKDFYIIHDTMKNLLSDESKRNEFKPKQDNMDDVIEISDNSLDSAISIHSSTFSSDDANTSVMSEESFKPFKLTKKY